MSQIFRPICKFKCNPHSPRFVLTENQERAGLVNETSMLQWGNFSFFCFHRQGKAKQREWTMTLLWLSRRLRREGTKAPLAAGEYRNSMGRTNDGGFASGGWNREQVVFVNDIASSAKPSERTELPITPVCSSKPSQIE